MSQFPIFFPAIGTASAATDLANCLGHTVETEGGLKRWRLVKAEDAIAAAASLLVSTTLSSGVPTWIVDLPGTTGASVSTPVGVIPAGQVGSSGTTGLLAGDYFLVQIAGPTKCIAGGTLAALDSVGATGTAGKIDTSTTPSVIIGTATEAASAADETIDVMLRGLL